MDIIQFAKPCVPPISLPAVFQNISASPKSTWIAAPLSCLKKSHMKRVLLLNHWLVHCLASGRRVCNRDTAFLLLAAVFPDYSISSLPVHWAQATYLQLISVNTV